MGRVALVACAVTLLAGCGGGDDDPELYTLESTRACLSDAGVEVSENRDDFVASTALGGSMRADFPSDNTAVLSFGESLEDAARTEDAYRDFAPADVPLESLLGRYRNVVMIWSFGPSGQDLKTVSDCLES
jgi:hypothetical protein